MSLLRDIINKWVEITEVDPNSKVFYSKNFDKTCNYQRKNNMLSISLWQEVDNFYSSRRKQLFFQKDTKGLKYGWNYGCYLLRL